MELPKNLFKARLRSGTPQIGVWNGLPGGLMVELLACAGYDWIALDTEHGPVEVSDVVPMLQVLEAFPDVSAMVRPAINDPVLIKRHLDQGAQTLLIPFVQSPEEARAAVAATRYAPDGVRGMAGLTRASRFGRVPGYVNAAADEICVILQVETAEAAEQLEAIATTPGVDAVFIGPSDLAASMGYPGQAEHPEVRALVLGLIDQLKDLGVPSGIITLDAGFAAECLAKGVAFIATSVDLRLLSAAADDNVRDLRAALAGV